MNKGKLTALCHKISKDTGLTFNSVMTYYFLERILIKLAGSSYQDKLVFKGGFLLSNVVGLKSRATVDIDFLIQNYTLSEENILNALQESLTTDEDIQYSITEVETIKEEDPYGGLRVKVLCQLDNIRQTVPLDIATGDVITPYPISYEYISLFDKERIEINAYNLETMLAEKLETLYRRDLLNSRSKDFYDLYILYKLKLKEIDFKNLKKACASTFRYRQTEYNPSKILEVVSRIKDDEVMIKRWETYSKKNSYAKDITFSEIMNVIEMIIDRL